MTRDELISYGADQRKSALQLTLEIEQLYKEKSNTGFGINEAIVKLLGKSRYNDFCTSAEKSIKVDESVTAPQWFSKDFIAGAKETHTTHGIPDNIIAHQWERIKLLEEIASWMG